MLILNGLRSGERENMLVIFLPSFKWQQKTKSWGFCLFGFLFCFVSGNHSNTEGCILSSKPSLLTWCADSAWGHGGLQAFLTASLAASIQSDFFILQPAPPWAPARGRNWGSEKRWYFQKSPELSGLEHKGPGTMLCVSLCWLLSVRSGTSDTFL